MQGLQGQKIWLFHRKNVSLHTKSHKEQKDSKMKELYDIDSPKYIVLEPDTTYSPLFWNEEGAAIGDYDSFSIGDEEYSTSSI